MAKGALLLSGASPGKYKGKLGYELLSWKVIKTAPVEIAQQVQPSTSAA
jgi:hypothetical protein